MPTLTKQQLLAAVEVAVRESGWGFLHLPSDTQHPASYQFYQHSQHHQVLIYIWNLTGGGQNRPRDEWRIQATGIDRFRVEEGAKTLVLGWQNEWSVFAGFDVTRHLNALGNSPSIQLREAALQQAVVNGFAPHNKGNGELAIAFRPDFLASYVDNLESLHGCGQVNDEVELLGRIAQTPDEVNDGDVAAEIAEPRRYAVISTMRAVREVGFRRRVLTAYGQRCAMCGIQLQLLEGAHILPAAHPESTDDTNNGIALCVLHHRAFDRALVTFDPDFRIGVNENAIQALTASDQIGGLDEFRRALRPMIELPPDRRDRPDTHLVKLANALRGW